jgi:flagellar biosynthesis anti-sigma factor FlgM
MAWDRHRGKKQLLSLEGPDLPGIEESRAARVEAIKQAIAAGTYRVDDRELADGLLSDLLREEWERRQMAKLP